MAAGASSGNLGPTTSVILGMLSFGPKSGYEIKAFVDRSTRFFWAASYGQIYPELRRLTDAGLITGTDASQGERRRTVYELTPSGQNALRAWLETPAVTYEMRHEGMLKLFFADALRPRERVERMRDLGRVHAEKVAALRVIEEAAAKAPRQLGVSRPSLRNRIQRVGRRMVRARGRRTGDPLTERSR